jgi:hypothetical protein
MRGRMNTMDSNPATRKQITGSQSRAWHLLGRTSISLYAIFRSVSLKLPEPERYDTDSTNMPLVNPHFSTAFGSQSRGQHTSGSPRWIHVFFQPDRSLVEPRKKIIVKSWLCSPGVRAGGCSWFTVSRPWTNSNRIHLHVSPEAKKKRKRKRESGRCSPKGVFVFLTGRADDIGMICPVILFSCLCLSVRGMSNLEARWFSTIERRPWSLTIAIPWELVKESHSVNKKNKENASFCRRDLPILTLNPRPAVISFYMCEVQVTAYVDLRG